MIVAAGLIYPPPPPPPAPSVAPSPPVAPDPPLPLEVNPLICEFESAAPAVSIILYPALYHLVILSVLLTSVPFAVLNLVVPKLSQAAFPCCLQ